MKEGIQGGQRRSGCRVKLLDLNQNNSKEMAENNGGSQRKKDREGMETELTWDPQQSGGNAGRREMLDRLD